MRADLEVQVDAPLFTRLERTRVTNDSDLAWFTVGGRYEFAPRWSLAAEALYVPLYVRRPPEFDRSLDSLASARVQLRYAFD